MKVRIDRKLCTGVGNCVALLPGVFALDEERKAVLLDVSSADDDALLDAAKSCPEDAIIIEDDDGNQIYP